MNSSFFVELILKRADGQLFHKFKNLSTIPRIGIFIEGMKVIDFKVI